MSLITMEQVRNQIRTVIPMSAPYQKFKDLKMENINNFDNLPRVGLVNGQKECRLLLYETLAHEKVFMQYPGIESNRNGARKFGLDARPVLQKADGSYSEDMDFKKIWDIIDRIGESHRADTDILATIFLRIAYMVDYLHNDKEYTGEIIDVATNRVLSTDKVHFVWNSLNIDKDVIETLNDRFGTCSGISLEGFFYYNDLLAQNEDCKYHYLKGARWNINTGRINNCLSHLTVISHIRGKIGISKLIDSFQRLGVAPLPQERFSEACGDLVIREK